MQAQCVIAVLEVFMSHPKYHILTYRKTAIDCDKSGECWKLIAYKCLVWWCIWNSICKCKCSIITIESQMLLDLDRWCLDRLTRVGMNGISGYCYAQEDGPDDWLYNFLFLDIHWLGSSKGIGLRAGPWNNNRLFCMIVHTVSLWPCLRSRWRSWLL